MAGVARIQQIWLRYCEYAHLSSQRATGPLHLAISMCGADKNLKNYNIGAFGLPPRMAHDDHKSK